MTYDQAQSPRLGQRTPVESTYVRMFSWDEIPEAAWPGQIIYRNEYQTLQIFNGEAWEDVVSGTPGVITFVGPNPPTAQHVGDIWFNTGDTNHMYVAASIGANQIAAGEWEDVSGQTPPVTSTTHIYQQDTPPGASDVPPPKDDDFWFETPDNKQYYYRTTAPGTHWVAVRDAGIEVGLTKTKVTYSTSAPTTEENSPGDTWYTVSGSSIISQHKGQGGSSWAQVEVSGDLLVDGTVTATTLSGDAVNGKTITGAVFQTAEDVGPGVQGMQLSTDVAGGVIKFWTGGPNETGAGWINPYAVDGLTPVLEIASPAAPDPDVRAKILLVPGQPAIVTVQGQLDVNNDCYVTGHLEADGSMTAAQVYATNPDSTTSGTDVKWVSGGQYRTLSSLSALKLDQQELSLDDVRSVLDLTPKTWFDRAEADAQDGDTTGLRRIPGLIAEDVEETAPVLATYLNEALHGVAYDRVAALLIPIIRDQQATIDRMEQRLTTLEAGDGGQ